jgi:hypothetical protein
MTDTEELGREGGPEARTTRDGQRAATEGPEQAPAEYSSRERPQESTGAPRSCICGCGESVRGKKARFRPGHDARLYGELKRNLKKDPLLRNERFTEAQRAYAKERGLI